VPLKSASSINEYYMAKEGLTNMHQVAEHRLFDTIEKEVQEYENFLNNQTKNLKEINTNYEQLKDYHEAVRSAHQIIAKTPKGADNFSFGGRELNQNRSYMGKDEESKENTRRNIKDETNANSLVKVDHLVGTINTADLLRFKQLLFRATRGNALIHSKSIESKRRSGLKTNTFDKSSFIITFQEGEALRAKLERIGSAYNVKTFDYPEANTEQVLTDLELKIGDTKKLLKDSNSQLRNYLVKLNDLESKDANGRNSSFYGVSTISLYRMFVQIEESIYSNMNCLKSVDNGNIQYGFVWSKLEANELTKELHNKGQYLPELQFQDVVDHDFERPTYFELNAFTSQFQTIIDTYGIPKYKEINPTVFTIVTFPFLFGVMFGDIGHGGLLFIIAC